MTREELIDYYSKKAYIGDSVYIHFDGYHFILETINGLPSDPSNRIALDPNVINNLLGFRERCYEDFVKLSEIEAKQSKL